MLKRINPSFKCIAVLVPALMLSFSYKTALNLWVFFVCMILLAISRVPILKVMKMLIPVLIAAIGLFMTGYLFSKPGEVIGSSMGKSIVYPASVESGLMIATRVLAFAGLGMAFSFTTPSKDFVYSLEQQCRMPSQFAYGVLAAFHLAPIMPHEYKKTKYAFAARGQNHFPLSPKILIPFVIKSVRWSESLSIAMESKGFDQEAKRTCLRVMQVRWFDYAFTLSSIGLTFLGMLYL